MLRFVGFRRFVISYGTLLTSLSIQRLLLSWTVLVQTESMLQVGLVAAAQFAPMLIFSLWAGVVADRYSKRRILVACHLGFISLAVAATVLSLCDALGPLAIFTLSILIGVVQSFQNPAAHSVVGELVPRSGIASAVSFVSSAFQAGQIVGPAIGGVVLALTGNTWSWGLNVALLGISIVLVMTVHPRPPERPEDPHAPPRATFAAGAAYVWRRKTFVWLLALVLCVAFCAYSNPVFLMALAQEEFRLGAAGFGMLNAVLASGSFAGALTSARHPSPRVPTVIIFTVTLGLGQIAAGMATLLPLLCAALVVRGASSLLLTNAANAFLQLNSHPSVRGRVLAFYGVMLDAGQCMGNLAMGLTVALYGVRPTLVLAGSLPILAALLTWAVLRRRFGSSLD